MVSPARTAFCDQYTGVTEGSLGCGGTTGCDANRRRVQSHPARWRFDVRSREAADAVRFAFVETLRRARYPLARLLNAEIVLGELLGNAFRYAPGTVDLTLAWENSRPVLHLLDRGPGFRFVTASPPDLYSERGRGLFLIAALAEEFVVSGRPEGGTHARVVLPPS